MTGQSFTHLQPTLQRTFPSKRERDEAQKLRALGRVLPRIFRLRLQSDRNVSNKQQEAFRNDVEGNDGGSYSLTSDENTSVARLRIPGVGITHKRPLASQLPLTIVGDQDSTESEGSLSFGTDPSSDEQSARPTPYLSPMTIGRGFNKNPHNNRRVSINTKRKHRLQQRLTVDQMLSRSRERTFPRPSSRMPKLRRHPTDDTHEPPDEVSQDTASDYREAGRKRRRHQSKGVYLLGTRSHSHRTGTAVTASGIHSKTTSSPQDYRIRTAGMLVSAPAASTLKAHSIGRLKRSRVLMDALTRRPRDATGSEAGDKYDVLFASSRIALDLQVPKPDANKHRLGSAYFTQTRLAQLLMPDNLTAIWVSDGLGLDLQSCRDLTSFEELLPRAVDRLFQWASGIHAADDDEVFEVMHSLGKLVEWHCRDLEESSIFVQSVHAILSQMAERAAQWLLVKNDESRILGHRILWVSWASVELSFRVVRSVGRSVLAVLDNQLQALLNQLNRIDLSVVIESLRKSPPSIPICSHPVSVWVCFIHLHQYLHHYYSLPTFWERILARFEDPTWLPPPPFQGELVWTTTFVVSALSQFSALGTVKTPDPMPSCWPLVILAISNVQLSEDPSGSFERKILEKRDLYIRGLLARCLLLHSKWGWSLTGSVDLLNELTLIFRSRKFNALHGEPAGFPSFILNPDDLDLINEFDPHDTAFDVFLKLIIGTSHDALQELSAPDAHKVIKKVLSMMLPVGSAQYTHRNPPTPRELTGLYHRYAATLVAAMVDPDSFTTRLQHARRYSDFTEADWMSRQAIIRTLMYFTIFAVKKGLEKDKLLEWMFTINDQLLGELRQFDVAGRSNHLSGQPQSEHEPLYLTLQMSLGAIRLIFKTMTGIQDVYPDPSLLRAPWLVGLLNTSARRSTAVLQEIRDLLLQFFVLRRGVLPVHPASGFDSSEDSQEDYAHFSFDLNDPSILALTGVEVAPNNADQLSFERIYVEAAEILDPVLYDLVNKEISLGGDGSLGYQSLDLWIRCWCSCAQVLVANGKESWSVYFQLGRHSWGRIMDPIVRYQVGVRFMHDILRLDASAYYTYQERFIEMWFECVAMANIDVEHSYSNELFAIDRFRHKLFQGLDTVISCSDKPCFPSPESFDQARTFVLRHVLSNISQSAQATDERPNKGTTAKKEEYQGYVVAMVTQMQRQVEVIEKGKDEYIRFCRVIEGYLREMGVLDEREEGILGWMSNLGSASVL